LPKILTNSRQISPLLLEISIKSKLGKLKISENYINELEKEGFLELPIKWIHSHQVTKLPLIHNDPFDRLLIAQTQIEKLALLTVDEHIKKYKVKVL
jgi:PIN domain nuclease of toxin-antitoxin system